MMILLIKVLVGNFRGVQNFVDFVGYLTHKNH